MEGVLQARVTRERYKGSVTRECYEIIVTLEQHQQMVCKMSLYILCLLTTLSKSPQLLSASNIRPLLSSKDLAEYLQRNEQLN